MAKKTKGSTSGNGGETSFEEDLDRLQEIVDTLEMGDLPLHEAMALYEEGVSLSKRCGQRLDEAEAKIEVLMQREGRVERAPFEDGE